MATKSGERYAEDLVVVVAALRPRCRVRDGLSEYQARRRPIRIQGRGRKRKLRRPQQSAVKV